MSGNNPQDRNVGNTGDILKHAALVKLVKLFAGQITGTKYYLDTHSYLYQSHLANADWPEQCAALLKPSSVYADYIELEMPYISKSEYLCSSGIVNKLLPDAHLLLCESNSATRECLSKQLAGNNVNHHTVKERLIDQELEESPTKLPNLLLLIDPFQLDEPLWLAVNEWLVQMLHFHAPAVMLVFDYIKQADKSWPLAPHGWYGPVASLSRQPYHLAIYATWEFVKPVQTQFMPLAWRMGQT